MPTRCISAIVVIAVVAACSLVAQQAPRNLTVTSPTPPSQSITYGAHMDLTWILKQEEYRNQRINAAATIGVQVGRNSLLWEFIEPAEGQYDWSVPDSVIQHMKTANIEPLFTVIGSPAWANGTNSESDPEYFLQVPQNPQTFNVWVSKYSRFMSLAAKRYKGIVTRWELGNEQNWEHFWKPRPNLDQYAYWYNQLSAAILTEDPAAQIASGGLTLLTRRDQEIGPNISGITFIKGLWSRGIHPKAIAIHLYSDHDPTNIVPGADNFLDILEIRKLLVDNGESRTSLWVTEWGWDKALSPIQRSTYMAGALQLFRDRFSSFVSLAIYFPLYDNPPSDDTAVCAPPAALDLLYASESPWPPANH